MVNASNSDSKANLMNQRKRKLTDVKVGAAQIEDIPAEVMMPVQPQYPVNKRLKLESPRLGAKRVINPP